MTKPRDLSNLGGGFIQPDTGTFTAADAEEFTAALAAGLLDDTYSLA
jgi:hypothetical protein